MDNNTARALFEKYKHLKIAVIGDYCLDEYLWIDAALNEPSLETGLTAYQCVRRESCPGAAGTVAKNFANLGVGKVCAVGYVGDDGRGLELTRGLERLGIDAGGVTLAADRVTPAYTKPWIIENGQTREMNRIDIKNLTPTPPALEDAVIERLERLIGAVDALVVMDQMTEDGRGVITGRVRGKIEQIARENPNLIVYADSRSRIGLFRGVIIKGNEHEIPPETRDALVGETGKPVIVTQGEKGVKIYERGKAETLIPAMPVTGQTDVCGAGDMFTASFVAALAGGADMGQAARLGNIAAAVCVTQLGTSGRVTTEDILIKL